MTDDVERLSRPLHGLGHKIHPFPSDKSLGYYQSSAAADWTKARYMQSP